MANEDCCERGSELAQSAADQPKADWKSGAISGCSDAGDGPSETLLMKIALRYREHTSPV
jgi:hypothetical protein